MTPFDAIIPFHVFITQRGEGGGGEGGGGEGGGGGGALVTGRTVMIREHGGRTMICPLSHYTKDFNLNVLQSTKLN